MCLYPLDLPVKYTRSEPFKISPSPVSLEEDISEFAFDESWAPWSAEQDYTFAALVIIQIIPFTWCDSHSIVTVSTPRDGDPGGQ